MGNSNPNSNSYPMAGNQFILSPSGILDRLAARMLVEEIGRLAESHDVISVDCARIEPALYEGLDEFRTAAEKLRIKGRRFQLEFTNIPEPMLVQMQLCDLPVSGNQMTLEIAEKSDEIRSTAPAKKMVIICHKCEYSIRLPGAGLYACPNCGMHFYCDRFGEAAFYESLRKLL